MTVPEEEIIASIIGLKKSFFSRGVSEPVLADINLDLRARSITSVFGPNGCGKSTLLHIIAGLISPDFGKIRLHGDGGGSPQVGIIFQDYGRSLMPWRTCMDNIILPLERHHGKRAARALAEETLETLNVRLPLRNYPHQMSGGQKQLTCLARSLVQRPALLLMDEPFAALDHETRIAMRATLQDIWLKAQFALLFVSHEIDEAIALSDRLVVLTKRPAKVARSFEIGLERPRAEDVFEGEAFFEIRREILREYRREIAA